MAIVQNYLDNKKAQHPVGLFRIGCLGITPVVPHVLVSHLSLLFYVLEHPVLYVPII
jgi:hypothetical protein